MPFQRFWLEFNLILFVCVLVEALLVAFQNSFEKIFVLHKRIVFKHVLCFSKNLVKHELAENVPDNSIYQETLSLCTDKLNDIPLDQFFCRKIF